MQGELFEPADSTSGPSGHDGKQSEGAAHARTERVVNSALWASWADALGFISELTTSQGLKRRLKGRPLSEPVEWTRRVGGRGGPDVVLPAGTYSDDTQLRLATGRCISGRGFDVEAFAHVELPGWLAYALGGGVGTKAAAARMMKPAAVWYAGQHDGWIRGGGNGAAMRIQPHVWASPVVASPGPWLAGLLADSCSTHAHPRALLGAVFHAYALSVAVSTGRLPDTSVWVDLLDAAAHDALEELRRHPEISDYWIGAYDKAARADGLPAFMHAWELTTQEMRSQVQLAVALCREAQGGLDWYASLIAELGLRDKATRGAGSTTVIAALALAHVHHESPGVAGLRASLEIDTDTDTIATMAAALAGATSTTPPAPVGGGEDFSDRGYITFEAKRLARLATDGTTDSTPVLRYPDLLTWSLPKTQVDLVGTDGEQLWLAGLSALRLVDREPARRGEFVWQWFETDWQQHVLVKTRNEPKRMPVALMPVHAGAGAGRGNEIGRRPSTDGASSQDLEVRAPGYPENPDTRVTVESAISFLRRHDFAHDRVGYAIAQMARTATKEEFEDFTLALRRAFLEKG